MQMQDKIEEISKRLDALENEYHSDKKVVRAVAAVFVVLFVAFFGISLSQIKSHVNKAMDQTAINEINEAKSKAEKALEAITKAERQTKEIFLIASDIDPSKKYKLTPFHEFRSGNYKYRYSPRGKEQGTGWDDKGFIFYAVTVAPKKE